MLKSFQSNITPGRQQSKTPILSRNLDQKSIDTVFRLTFVAPLATNVNQKHCFYRFFFRIHRLLITFSIAAYPALSSTGSILSNIDLSDLSIVGTCDIFVYPMRHRVM